MTTPPKRITDRSFRYVNSANTSVAKTFARIRRELKAEREREAVPNREGNLIRMRALAKRA